MSMAESFFNEAIESKLLNMHTAYIGKIVSVNGSTATVQPLNMIKQVGQNGQNQAVIPNVPILSHCKGKITETMIGGVKALTFAELASGDLVFCVCAERDITDAKNGKSSVPPVGHHNLSDSVIVGVL